MQSGEGKENDFRGIARQCLDPSVMTLGCIWVIIVIALFSLALGVPYLYTLFDQEQHDHNNMKSRGSCRWECMIPYMSRDGSLPKLRDCLKLCDPADKLFVEVKEWIEEFTRANSGPPINWTAAEMDPLDYVTKERDCYVACARETTSLHCRRDCDRIYCDRPHFEHLAHGDHWTTAFVEGSLRHEYASTKTYYRPEGAACYDSCNPYDHAKRYCDGFDWCDRHCYTVNWATLNII